MSALHCLCLTAWHVLSCSLACHVNRFSDSTVGSKVSQGVDSHGAVPTKVICFIAVFGAALWVVSFAPHLHKPKDDCVCKIVGNRTMVAGNKVQSTACWSDGVNQDTSRSS